MSLVSKNLRVFMTVARCGSMSKASSELCLSLSPISRIIAEFEEHFSRTFFERHGRGVRLTREGMEFYERLNPAYMELVNFEKQNTRKPGRQGYVVHYDWSADPDVLQLQTRILADKKQTTVQFVRAVNTDYFSTEMKNPDEVYILSEPLPECLYARPYRVISDTLRKVSSCTAKVVSDKVILTPDLMRNYCIKSELTRLHSTGAAGGVLCVDSEEMMREMILSGAGFGLLPSRFSMLPSWQGGHFSELDHDEGAYFSLYVYHTLSERGLHFFSHYLNNIGSAWQDKR